jgi:hypothetical protein
MKRALLVALLLLAGCTPGVWRKQRAVNAGGVRARLYLPNLYQPLLPGSIYPDKRKPLAVAGRPGAVVLLPSGAKRDTAVAALGERGFVVLTLSGGAGFEVDRAIAWLRERPECRGGKVVAIVPAGTAVKEAAAVAVMGEPVPPASSAPFALFALTPGGPRPAEGRWSLVKWYRPGAHGGFPPEAWRDAAEWLALVLDRG